MAQNLRIRQARPEDINAVTALMIKCMDEEENWNYRMPYRHDYPEDHWKYQKLYIEYMIDEENEDFEVLILEVENPDSIWTMVALSIWDVSYVNKRLHGPSYVVKQLAVDNSARRDSTPIRSDAFMSRVLQARQSNNEAFGIDQLYLRILGTHPDYRRRGFGSKLLKLGIDRATRDGVVLTLMSSQQSSPTYIACGFQELESISIQAKDEDVSAVMSRMVYMPEKKTATSISQ
ncbi:hypothetical protein ACMFMG_000379 [Clarireedia jacksonii]